jgi:hypothetical protein
MEQQNQPIEKTAIELRQEEVDAYTSNVNNYNALLSLLDGNWDADLIHLKDLEGQEAARQCPMNRLERLAVLQQYEQVSKLIKTETVERAKAAMILQVLKSQQI